jgi:hypothetical protein
MPILDYDAERLREWDSNESIDRLVIPQDGNYFLRPTHTNKTCSSRAKWETKANYDF